MQGGEATSYLLDAAEMQPEADAINGAYYYGIHVTSDLVSPENREQFLEDDEEGDHHRYLEAFLNGINEGQMEAGWNLPTQNPPANLPSDVGDFNFGLMSDTAGANTLFTLNTPVGPQVFRYLAGPAHMGVGNHLIIRNDTIRVISWNSQEVELTRWFNNDLPNDLKAMVAPVASSFSTGMGDFLILGGGWAVDPTSLAANNVVANDLIAVVPLENGGVRRAFALSLPDVQRLSAGTPGIGFMNNSDRSGANNSWWWLRTSASDFFVWTMDNFGPLHHADKSFANHTGGVRPALIIYQPGT